MTDAALHKQQKLQCLKLEWLQAFLDGTLKAKEAELVEAKRMAEEELATLEVWPSSTGHLCWGLKKGMEIGK